MFHPPDGKLGPGVIPEIGGDGHTPGGQFTFTTILEYEYKVYVHVLHLIYLFAIYHCIPLN